MTEILIWDGERLDIAFDNGTRYEGLHCGKCIFILQNNMYNKTDYLIINNVFSFMIACFGKKGNK